MLNDDAGVIGVQPGPMLSAGDSIRITVFGKGSHGSMPHLSIDPVVLAATIVVRLQTIVAREIAPGDFGVVTVGALNAGARQRHPRPRDDAPQPAHLRRGRPSRDHRRRRTHRARRVRRRALPQPPTFEYYDRYPLTDNDADVTATVRQAFTAHFGAERVIDLGRVPASEDFSRLPDAFGTPYSMWGVGGFNPGEGVPNHNARFAPLLQPTLDTSTEAVVVAAMTYLGHDRSDTDRSDTQHGDTEHGDTEHGDTSPS